MDHRRAQPGPVWRWFRDPPPDLPTNDLSDANERRCAEAAKLMMQWLLPSFELINPLPPYPPAWEQLADVWDRPVWAVAKASGAQYVVSEKTHDYPPARAHGRHVYYGIEYLRGDAFLRLLRGTDLE